MAECASHPHTPADLTHLGIEKAALRCNYEAGDRVRHTRPLYLEDRYQEDPVRARCSRDLATAPPTV